MQFIGCLRKNADRTKLVLGEHELNGTAAGICGLRRLGAAGSSAPNGSPRALPWVDREMPERVGNDGGWFSEHQPFPDCGGGVGAVEAFQDLEAEVDCAACSTSGYYAAVCDCRGFDIFCALPG